MDMIENQWRDKEWEELTFSIHRGKCILMLGPDASEEKVNGEFQPLMEVLARELHNEIIHENESSKSSIDIANLAQVSQHYCIKRGKTGLEKKVCSFFGRRINDTSKLHKDLAELPFYFTITSTPDKMFYNALKDANKNPRIERYNRKGYNPPIVNIKITSKETPLLYYLYGCLDDPESIVLSENDLLHFLKAVISGSPPLPTTGSNFRPV